MTPKRKFTKDEMLSLSRWEGQMRRAVERGYLTWPGREAVSAMDAAYQGVYGIVRRRFNAGCGVCVLNLLRDVGNLYFAQKAEERVAVNAEKGRRRKAEIRTEVNHGR